MNFCFLSQQFAVFFPHLRKFLGRTYFTGGVIPHENTPSMAFGYVGNYGMGGNSQKLSSRSNPNHQSGMDRPLKSPSQLPTPRSQFCTVGPLQRLLYAPSPTWVYDFRLVIGLSHACLCRMVGLKGRVAVGPLIILPGLGGCGHRMV